MTRRYYLHDDGTIKRVDWTEKIQRVARFDYSVALDAEPSEVVPLTWDTFEAFDYMTPNDEHIKIYARSREALEKWLAKVS